MKKIAEDELIRMTGCPVTYAHGPKVLRWKTEYRDVYNRIDKFVEPVTYVVGRLCGLTGEQAYIDYTNIHFSGFADNEKLCWSEELCKLFDVDRNKLPNIVAPYQIAGKLTGKAADLMGLVSGIPRGSRLWRSSRHLPWRRCCARRRMFRWCRNRIGVCLPDQAL